MKKAKRFLTGLLSAALALSLCAMPAMADTPAPELPEATNTTDSVINPNQKGSITIYKYLHAEKINSVAGTGEKQNIPDGTEPAEDVGFTIYQVKNATELQAYYDGETSDKVAKASDYLDEKGNVLKKYNTTIVDADKVGEEKKTDANGMVQFTNLPVGLYLVMETSKPATVTEPVEPFLVSIPMTRVTEDPNAQKQWLYDVVVYPKNSTHKGSITLKKVGVVGEEAGTPLAGVKFSLDRLKDDDTNTWVPYPDDKTTFETTAPDGSVTIDGLKPGTYRFKEIGYSDTVTGENRKYVINAGDYYVFTIAEDGKVSRAEDADHSSDYTAENTTVTVKNYAPDIEKTVKDRTSDEYRKAADYNVGDEIPYKITVTVPQNITRLKKFEVTDTPTNLKDQVVDAKGNSLISVQYNSDEGLVAVPTDAYTIAELGNGFKVTFVPAKMEAYAGKQIVISYKAILTDDADMTTDGNSNQAKLEYSNKTDVKDEDKDAPENNNKRGDETVVYTFQIQIVKKADVQENGKDIFLDGVTFDLYKLVGKTEKIPDDAIEISAATANALKLPAAGADQKWVKVKSDITTGTDGKVNVNGLANGTYYLVETKTKQGYNLLKAPVKVELSIAYKTTWNESLEYKGDVLVKRDVTKKVETFTKDGTQTGVTEGDKTYGRHVTEIINRKGFDLPTTGGFGTLLFSGIGVLLVVAGVGVLLSLKKKNRA